MTLNFPKSIYTAAEATAANISPANASPSDQDTGTIGSYGFTFDDDRVDSNGRWVMNNGSTYSLTGGATYTWDLYKWKASNIPDSSTAVQTTTTQTLENKTLDDYAELTSTRTENTGTFLVNASLAHIHNITTSVNSNATVSIDDGQSVTLHITAGTNTVNFNTISWIGGSAPTLSTSGATVIEFWKIGTTIYGAAVGDI